MEICEVAGAGIECRAGQPGDDSSPQKIQDVFAALLASLVESLETPAVEPPQVPEVGHDTEIRTCLVWPMERTSLQAGPPPQTEPARPACPGPVQDLEPAALPHQTADQLASAGVETDAHMPQERVLTSRVERRSAVHPAASPQGEAESKPRAIRVEGLPEQAEPPAVRWSRPPITTRHAEPDPPALASTGSGEPTVSIREQAATGGQTEALEPGNVQDIAEVVVERVRLFRTQGTQTMEIQLKPERLGKLLVLVSVDEQGVSAYLKVQNPEARALVQSHLAELRTALAERGMTVLSLVVGDDSAGTGRDRISNDRRYQEDKGAALIQRLKRTGYVPVRAATAFDCRV
ncbi:MAG: flagellar hook-length control protein FliK [Bacillota bacterium]